MCLLADEVVVDRYWPLLAVTDHCWPLLTIFDLCWPILAIDDHYWPLLTIDGRCLMTLVIVDDWWPLLSIDVSCWPFSVVETDPYLTGHIMSNSCWEITRKTREYQSRSEPKVWSASQDLTPISRLMKQLRTQITYWSSEKGVEKLGLICVFCWKQISDYFLSFLEKRKLKKFPNHPIFFISRFLT